ncbi:MAG: bifunctional nuclease family protein [Paraprevotella sp.]|nr:bifunctional nuclease family protein [Paraprevotella sp.]
MADDIRELRVQAVSKCTKDGSMYIAILQERDGKRILPILIDGNDAFQLLMKMKGPKDMGLPSSMSEVMKAAFQQCGMDIEEIRIAAVQGGITYCHILYTEKETYHMIRYCKASDCLILAYTFGCPITINNELLEQQYMREVGDGTYSIPVNSVNIEALEEALQRAVEDENYELASQLRDEIERRK